MGFFKRLFGLEKKESYCIDNTAVQPEVIEDKKIYPFSQEICGLCKELIGEQRYKKVQNYYVHKRCFKNKKREIMNGG